MSADNFIAVFSEKDSLGRDMRWYVAEGMMPSIESDEDTEKWKNHIIEKHTNNRWDYPTRESALVAAHDMLKRKYIVEYGVIEI
jgi:hypothetical protein